MTDHDGLWEALHERLVAEMDTIVDAAVGRFRTELPGYAAIAPERLRPGTRRNVAYILASVAQRRPPLQSELADAETVGAVRASQGIPTDELMRGFRIAVQEIWARENQYARAAGVGDAALLEAAQRMWEWADILMARAAKVHRQVELEAVRHDRDTRANLLRGILFGSIGPNELRLKAPAYGLHLDRDYVPVRVRPGRRRQAQDLENELAAASRVRGANGFLGIVDGDLAGVLPERPELPATAVAGVGPPARLGAMSEAFRAASVALETAAAFGLGGTLDLGQLGLRVQVLTGDDIGERLVARYLEPLAGASSGPVLERTLGTYFAHGMRVDETARALFIHPNTLRRRLRKYERLTGADLRQAQQLLEVWWALERKKVTQGLRP